MTGRAGRTVKAGHQASAGDLLELVRSGRATTRGALQQATGLSRATVGQRLERLFRAGWLREGATGPVDSPLGGRPSITLEFDDAHAVVLAADLDNPARPRGRALADRRDPGRAPRKPCASRTARTPSSANSATGSPNCWRRPGSPRTRCAA